MSATAVLSQWIVQTGYDDLPAEVVEHVKWCLTDSIACGIGGRATREADALVELGRITAGEGRHRILGEEGGFGMLQAAQANRVLINVLDYDDTIIRTGHMSSVAVAAALAAGEHCRSSGKALIAALAMSYEAALRIRHAVEPSLAVFRTTFERVDTGVGFCATIAAGKLLGLDAMGMADAFGLTGHVKPWHVTMAPMSVAGMPSWFKITQGDTVVPGLQAALLASLGFEGDRGIFDAGRGFERHVGSDRFDTEPLTRGRDPRFELLDIGFKLQTCCRHISAFAEGLGELMASHRLPADDIAEIRALTHLWTAENLANRHPTHMIGAQFSMPHILAMVALGVPAGAAWFAPGMLSSPKAAALRDRVRMVPDARAQSIYDVERRYAGEVEVVTTSGAALRHFVAAPRGTRDNPFSEADHERKLTAMARQGGLDVRTTARLWQMLRRLEDLDDVNRLTALFA